MLRLASLARLAPPDPISLTLDRARDTLVEDILAEHPEVVAGVERDLGEVTRTGDDAAATRVSSSCQTLIDTLRRRELPALPGASWLDRRLRSDAEELLDLPWVPRRVKQVSVALLDRVNRTLGAYDLWREEVTAALDGLSAARLHDLASGTGSFARYLAANPPEGIELELEASDIDPGYVELGRQKAAELGLSVRFSVQNAFDLASARPTDLFVCTQAAHHLSPGMIVRMIHQATLHAKKGVLVLDLFRSVGTLAGAALLLSTTAPFPPLVADGVQSVRRAYNPSELRMLATLAGATSIRTRVLGAAYTAMHASRS